jgi:hypothetical protein
MDKKTKTYVTVGVVAAVASAATAALIFWNRSRQGNRSESGRIESVEDLIDRCNNQVKSIETRLGDMVAA